MMLIEIERVAALKPQDSGHLANLDYPPFPATERKACKAAHWLP
jgi:hypothetical protein